MNSVMDQRLAEPAELSPETDKKPWLMVVSPPVQSVLSEGLARVRSALDRSSEADTFGDLASAEEADQEALLVVPLLSPVEGLAWQLEGTPEAGKALHAWLAETETLVAQTRKLRRRLRVVDARCLAHGRRECVVEFAPNADADLEALAGIAPAPTPSSSCLVLAHVMIGLNPRASQLASEIEALRRGPEWPLFGLDVAIRACDERIAAEAELSELRQSAEVLTTHLAERLAERDEFKRALEVMTEEQAAAAIALETARAESAAQDDAIKQVTQTGAALAAELASTKADLARASDDLAALTKRSAKLQASKDEADKQMQSLLAQDKELQKQLAASAAALAAAERTAASAQALNQKDVLESKAHIAALEGQITDTQKRLSEARAAVKSTEASLKKAKDQVGKMTDEASLLRESLNLHTQEISSVLSANDALEAKVSALMAALQTASAQSASQEAELARVQTANAAALAAAKAAHEKQVGVQEAIMRNERSKMRTTRKALADSLEAVRLEIETCQTRVAVLTDELRSSNDTVENERARIKVLEAEIAEIRASTSWKFTGPMRAVRNTIAPR